MRKIRTRRKMAVLNRHRMVRDRNGLKNMTDAYTQRVKNSYQKIFFQKRMGTFLTAYS